MTKVPRITADQYMFSGLHVLGTALPTLNSAIDLANLAKDRKTEANAEQSAQQESKYITATQARELGSGGAEALYCGNWVTCNSQCIYPQGLKYRAIKQAQPELEVATVLRSDFDYCMQDKQRCVRLIEDVYALVCDNKMSDAKAMIEKRVNNMAVNVPLFIEPEPFETEEESNASWSAIDAPIPHAALRAEYIRQRDAVPCELRFYKWEGRKDESKPWQNATGHYINFASDCQFRYTDISCYVSKDGEPAIRMLRTEAQELQRKLGDTVEWFTTRGRKVEDWYLDFEAKGIYTYRTKATIKLNGKMVTPEQAAAEREAKKDTHELWYRSDRLDWCIWSLKQWNKVENHNEHYELRPKQPTWTGSREDVIALLKEKGLL
jgi:hypothetical protein